MIKRWCTGLLAAAMVISLAACNGGGGTESGQKTESGGTVSAVGDLDTLPDLEISNKTVKVLTYIENMASPELVDVLKRKYGITLEVEVVPSADLQTKFINTVLATESPDLYYCGFNPQLFNAGYVQPWGDRIDLDSDLWKDIKDEIVQYNWKGNLYTISPKFNRYGFVYFNKSMFDEAGEEYPSELFKKGEWDWDRFYELGQILTLDPQKTGTPTQYGMGLGEVEFLLFTTGTHFITMNEDGTANNNLQSPEVARFIEYYKKVVQSGFCLPTSENTREAFGEGKVAMITGHTWYASGYQTLIAENNVGMAPLPKDPDADGTYTLIEDAGWVLPKGAENPEGAAAVLNCMRWVYSDEEVQKQIYEQDIAAGVWSEELQEMSELNEEVEHTLPALWAAFNVQQFWGEIFTRSLQGEPWATIAAEISPQIDFQINQMYEASVDD